MPENKEVDDDQVLWTDVKSLISILRRHWGLATLLFTLISSGVAGATAAISYFAKQEDLITRICERTIISEMGDTKIEHARYGTLKLFSSKIVNMFESAPEAQQNTYWTKQFTRYYLATDVKEKELQDRLTKLYQSQQDRIEECIIRESAK